MVVIEAITDVPDIGIIDKDGVSIGPISVERNGTTIYVTARADRLCVVEMVRLVICGEVTWQRLNDPVTVMEGDSLRVELNVLLPDTMLPLDTKTMVWRISDGGR